jgi:hypothetical protein
MKHLYISSTLSLDQLAGYVANTAMPGYTQEKRDGLNLGGGEYFKFSQNDIEILLVCNDTEHPEVFVESREQFPYYCYARRDAQAALDQVFLSLSKSGLICEFADEV